MKILLLSGKPNTGKTTVCNDLYTYLISSGAEILQPKQPVGGDPNDFECVLQFLKKKVVIYSMGDYYYACVKAIIKYADMDVLVLAYNNKFANDLESVIQHSPPNVLIRKTNSNKTDVNTVVANI